MRSTFAMGYIREIVYFCVSGGSEEWTRMIEGRVPYIVLLTIRNPREKAAVRYGAAVVFPVRYNELYKK